ncbi:hypothetical protein [Aquipuribacter sp. SD81]|uniref:hypothetical protein n=1 Tax=Aquipuribacter sp. SD81 TaxID=3127703 RepID=UPI00301ACB4F
MFAPPTGTLDVDWLVPAVLEAVPGSTPEQARTALVAAATAPGGPDDAGEPAGETAEESRPDDPDEVRLAADRVVAEARRSFRA